MSIPEHLLVQAKRLAADRRTSLTRVVEESLRSYLVRAREDADRARPGIEPLPINREAVPRVDLTDTSALMELQ